MANAITDLRELVVAAGQANKVLDDLERQALEAGVSTKKLGKLLRDVEGEANNLAAAGARLGLSQQALTRYNRDGAAAFMANYNALIATERATRSLQKSNNKMGTAFNQASFQVNDFFVQISSGTDAMVALGQQGSQLAQILTMFGGGLAIFGATLSVAIPLVTSILRSVNLFGDSLEKLSSKADKASGDILKLFDSAQETLDLKESVRDFENISELVQKIATDDLEILDQKLEKVFGKSWFQKVRDFAKGYGAAQLGSSEEVNKQLEKENELREKFQKLIAKALDAKNVSELNKSLEVLKKAQEEVVGLTEDQQRILDRSIKSVAERLAKKKEAVASELDSLKYETALLKMESEGVGTSAVRLAHAQDELALKLQKNGATKEEIKQGNELLQQAEDYRKEIEQRKEAEKLAKEAAELQKRTKIDTLGLEIQALKKLELTAETKADILEKSMEQFMLQKGITAEVDKQTEAEKKLLAAKFKALDVSLTGTRSGSKVKSAKDPLGTEIKANDKLIAQARVKALFAKDTWDYYSRMLAIQTDGTIIGDKRLGQLKSQYEELKKINEALEFRKELQDALVKSAYDLGEGIGSAFAKMGEGKSTMDKIGIFIKEITKAFLATELAVLAFTTLLTALSVPKDIAGALAGQIVMAGAKALEFANGGVFDQGVQKFANGGVVSQPTYFNMGLMGEAGPEAIMPLKRGRDGKLGVAANDNGGAVTVVQNFSFAANGDESVKKIIAQEAPKIAQLAQRVIIDNRRRGGATRGAFA